MRWDKEVEYKLRNFECNKIAIKKLEERIAITDEKKYNLKNQKIDEFKVQTSINNTDILLNLIVECEELRRQLREIRFEVKWLEDALNNLNFEEFRCFEEFYIKNNRRALNKLITDLNYSKSYVYKLTKDSLKKLTTCLYGSY